LILTQIFFNLYWDAHCPATYSVPYCNILQHTPAVLRCPHHKAGHVLEIISYAGLNVITLNGLSCGSWKHHWHYHSCTFTGHSYTADCYPVDTLLGFYWACSGYSCITHGTLGYSCIINSGSSRCNNHRRPFDQSPSNTHSINLYTGVGLPVFSPPMILALLLSLSGCLSGTCHR
jgi:hypothetical protein